ncbi:2-oxoacid:acceptor oxidoreductase family protein [Streptomyces sp. NPDC004673]
MQQNEIRRLDRVIIRFAGDSGDGMQLTGDRFTSETASFGNDLSTLPNFPAEIRAPAGTLPGVSSFQLHFADHDILTPGDAPNVLVAMNPAALKANIADVPRGAEIIVNTDEFSKRAMQKVGYEVSPLEDGSLDGYSVHPVPLTVEALTEFDLSRKDAGRSKNMFALRLLSWTEQADLLQAMYGRNGEAPGAIVAPRTPTDCFDAAIEAARIAVTYRTPVFLLSDGCLANGSEPWRIPEVDELPDLRVQFASGFHHTQDDGTKVFWPYKRDPQTLARPWAIPGTPGLEHRIGGIEKQDGTGNISYDPANHDFMVRTRQAKIDGIEVPDLEVDDAAGSANTLVLGWGSTYGPITAAVRRLRSAAGTIAQAHLRHLNPSPSNLGEVLRSYERVVITEMNLGQLATLIRARYLVDAVSYTQVNGMPFKAEQLATALKEVIDD